jgi:hypothetical protein
LSVAGDDFFYLTHVPACSSSSVLVQINVRDFYPDPVATGNRRVRRRHHAGDTYNVTHRVTAVQSLSM